MPNIPIIQDNPEPKGKAKKKPKVKLLEMPGRAPAKIILKEVLKDYDCKLPHEIIVLIHPIGGGVGITSNIFGSPDKVWLLEHAKLMVLSQDSGS